MNKDEAFEKFLKLEKQLYDEIDGKVSGSSRDSLKRMDKLRSQIREILPLVNQKKDGGLAEAIDKVKKEDVVKMEAGGDPANPLKGGQKKLDKNKDGKISGEDFEILRNMKFGGSVKPVKMGGGGNVCKGMGIARAGGKFKIR